MLRTDRRVCWTGPAIVCLAAMWGLGCAEQTAAPPVPPADLGAEGAPEAGSYVDSESGSSFGGTALPDDNPFSDAPSLIDTPDSNTATDTPDLDAPDDSDPLDNSDPPSEADSE